MPHSLKSLEDVDVAGNCATQPVVANEEPLKLSQAADGAGYCAVQLIPSQFETSVAAAID